LTRTKKLLRQSGLRARKGLAQHFLIDEQVLELIISTAQLTPEDVVVEVGPGLGVLTAALAERAGWVVAIELDDNLAILLKQNLSSHKNITIINRDVLKVNPVELSGEAGFEIQNMDYKVVANLPYYITSPVLRHFLEAEARPRLMGVMVQKEVAEEICARPGRMSLLSIGIQFYSEPEIVDYVSARSFYPAPEVDSALLKVTPHSQPVLEKKDAENFFSLVRAGFSASRKQLVNSLARGLGVPKEETISLLKEAEVATQRRAETLSLKEWVNLWRIYSGVVE